MMSLFSPFDLANYPLSMTLMLMITLNLIKTVFKLSKIMIFMNEISTYFSMFLYSLKMKNINKSLKLLMTSMFAYLFFSNFSSISPYNFPMTSQMGTIMFVSVTFWMSIILMPLLNSSKNFISHFMPMGTPYLLVPFLFLIELVSSIIRPLTVSVRLVANILAGHLLMILLSELALSNLPFYLAYVTLNGVELVVSIIQAYIFCTMITLYYSEIA